MEKFFELISSHIRDKKVTGNSQHIFTKGKSRQTNLIPFYNEARSSADKRRAAYLEDLNWLENQADKNLMKVRDI